VSLQVVEKKKAPAKGRGRCNRERINDRFYARAPALPLEMEVQQQVQVGSARGLRSMGSR